MGPDPQMKQPAILCQFMLGENLVRGILVNKVLSVSHSFW